MLSRLLATERTQAEEVKVSGITTASRAPHTYSRIGPQESQDQQTIRNTARVRDIPGQFPPQEVGLHPLATLVIDVVAPDVLSQLATV